MPDLTILHTNDLHNRLTDRSAAVLSARKAETNGLLLDAGDAVWAGNIYFRPGGEPVLGLMSEAGYDAMALGNREFHFTHTGLVSKLSRATYPVLCSNVRPAGGKAPPLQAFVNFEVSGVKICLFGLTVCMISPRSRTAAVSAFVFDDPVAAAPDVVEELRPTCDLLVALTHIGLRRDIELSKLCPGIDLIVGGHSHHVLEKPSREGRAPIVQAGSHGRFYGEVTLTRGAHRWDVAGQLRQLRAS